MREDKAENWKIGYNVIRLRNDAAVKHVSANEKLTLSIHNIKIYQISMWNEVSEV